MQTMSLPIVSAYADAKEVAFSGGLARIVGERAQTDGVFSVQHFSLRPGETTPVDNHRHHDKALFVLDGEARGVLGNRDWEATGGAFVWLPRGIDHTFESVGARSLEVLVMTIPD
jgi:mannose-6-phosphate isomerase-like protein (cupin superfamily)